MKNPILDLAAKLQLKYDAGDQDFYLMRASADRCLEFSVAYETIDFDGLQRGEVVGLVLASYQLYLEESPRNAAVENNLLKMCQIWSSEPWVREMLFSEGWREEGPFGDALSKLRREFQTNSYKDEL